MHFHGFPQAAPIFDGTPEGSITVNMGSTITYYYKINDPGTYMYHCHVESTEHMQMGMLGNLYVTPAQDGPPSASRVPVDTGATRRRRAAARDFNKFVYNDASHKDHIRRRALRCPRATPRIGATGYDVQAALQLGSFDANFHYQSETVQPLPFDTLRSTHTLHQRAQLPRHRRPAHHRVRQDARWTATQRARCPRLRSRSVRWSPPRPASASCCA